MGSAGPPLKLSTFLEVGTEIVPELNCVIKDLLEVVEDWITDANLTDPNTACHHLVFASIVLMRDE